MGKNSKRTGGGENKQTTLKEKRKNKKSKNLGISWIRTGKGRSMTIKIRGGLPETVRGKEKKPEKETESRSKSVRGRRGRTDAPDRNSTTLTQKEMGRKTRLGKVKRLGRLWKEKEEWVTKRGKVPQGFTGKIGANLRGELRRRALTWGGVSARRTDKILKEEGHVRREQSGNQGRAEITLSLGGHKMDAQCAVPRPKRKKGKAISENWVHYIVEERKTGWESF